jgi:hypothetical protein
VTFVATVTVDSTPKKDLLRKAFGMWQWSAAVGLVLIIGLWLLLLARRTRRRTQREPVRRRRRPIPDAWAEAGRRVEPIRMDEPEPPTAPEP